MRKAMRYELGLVLIVSLHSVMAQAAPADVSVAATAGTISAKGSSESSALATGGVALAFTWPVSRMLSLGFQQRLGITSIPYGNNDGELLPFRRSNWDPTYFKKSTTWIPAASFLVKYKPGFSLSLDGSIGLGALVGPSHPWLFITFGAGIELELVKVGTSSLNLRAQLDVWTSTDGKYPLVPQAGLAFAF